MRQSLFQCSVVCCAVPCSLHIVVHNASLYSTRLLYTNCWLVRTFVRSFVSFNMTLCRLVTMHVFVCACVFVLWYRSWCAHNSPRSVSISFAARTCRFIYICMCVCVAFFATSVRFCHVLHYKTVRRFNTHRLNFSIVIEAKFVFVASKIF